MTPKEEYDKHLLERASIVTHKILTAFPDGVTDVPSDAALWNPMRMLAYENLTTDLCHMSNRILSENIELKKEISLLKLRATAKSTAI